MPIVQISGVRSALGRMQGPRGLRAGLTVGLAMAFSLLAHRPLGWIALGALYVCLVDNGGPFRSRLANISAVLLPGSLAVLLGALAGISLPFGLLITVVACFCMTLLRTVSQPFASSSVLVLICYIVAFGHPDHTFAAAVAGAFEYLLGGLWAAVIALILVPIDPFRPARLAVAEVYASLLQLSAALPSTAVDYTLFNPLLAQTRLRIETAHAALAATPARMTARTVRARNLTVLTESADLLLARILRFAELSDNTSSPATLDAIQLWLTASLNPLESALRQHPADDGAAFAPEGSLAIDLHRSETRLETILITNATDTANHLIATLRDTLFNLEIADEAIRAIWTGAESRQPAAAAFRASLQAPRASTPGLWLEAPKLWLETLRANFTLRSLMFRYAIRLSAVVAVDVLIMHFLHVTHGYWLAMTSLIVLRPFAGETVRRSAERVSGTVAGGILAAAFTALFATHAELVFLVTLCSAGSVALYAVDYAWYCFFVTPTIVLLTLPRLHDWHLAAVRTEMTILGALVSVLAMLLLWPERESLQLPRLLARAAAADAAYLRATLAFWRNSTGLNQSARIAAERSILAPARRLCGLAVNDAEDTLDHALLEHSLPLNPRRNPTARLNSAALTFTTYLRRITRTTTALAAIGPDSAESTAIITNLASRLDTISQTLTGATLAPTITTGPSASLPSDHLRRLERQISILERTSNELTAATHT